ncbi:Uncharacterised protein [uncultured archaeon]|nr:Uncharacterised protein [uncultured archaeon]
MLHPILNPSRSEPDFFPSPAPAPGRASSPVPSRAPYPPIAGYTPQQLMECPAISNLCADRGMSPEQAKACLEQNWERLRSYVQFFEDSRTDPDAGRYCPKPAVSAQSLAQVCAGALLIERNDGFSARMMLAKWSRESQFDLLARNGQFMGLAQLGFSLLEDIYERRPLINDSLSVFGHPLLLPSSACLIPEGGEPLPLVMDGRINPKVGRPDYVRFISDAGHSMALSAMALLDKMTYVKSLRYKNPRTFTRKDWTSLLQRYNAGGDPDYVRSVLGVFDRMPKL